jgi:hypothetical protein
LCIVVGFAPQFLSEKIASGYRIISAEELNSIVGGSPNIQEQFPTLDAFQNFLDIEGNIAVSGKMIYPEYADQLDRNPSGGEIELLDFPQINFSLISEEGYFGVLPVRAEKDFGNLVSGTEVIVIGCERYLAQNGVVVQALIVLEGKDVTRVITAPPEFISYCE